MSIWGFAEATLFFIVPDVGLTLLAVSNRRRALMACAWVLAGALAGGAAMYAWGRAAPETAVRVVAAVPAVGGKMVEDAGRQLEQSGGAALFLGSITGRPYKIYAVQAAPRGMPLWKFLLVSLPARGLRFVLAVLIAAGLAARLPPRWTPHRRAICVVFWILFYGVFFATR
jgi:membrane protein YqaA with SNARE-associated domain